MILLSFAVPAAAPKAEAQETTSSCPSQAMPFALTLSGHVNQLGLANVTNNTSAQAIAQEINAVIPAINGTLNLNVPLLNADDLNKITTLTGPFDDFLTYSAQVNATNPDSACNFLGATLILAGDITILVLGDGAIEYLPGIIGVAVHYCDTVCLLSVEASITAYVAQQGSFILKEGWQLWTGTNCHLFGNCSNNTATSAPEFPQASLGVVAFAVLGLLALMASRYSKDFKKILPEPRPPQMAEIENQERLALVYANPSSQACVTRDRDSAEAGIADKSCT
jgi:hypothetical protein